MCWRRLQRRQATLEHDGALAHIARRRERVQRFLLHRVRPFLRTWVGEMTDTRQKGGKGWRCISGRRSIAFCTSMYNISQFKPALYVLLLVGILGFAIASESPEVWIIGTGGMSHQIHGERSGMINTKFDTAFLNDLTKNPKRLRKIKHEEYVRDSGAEGIEMVMWMAMRGALGDTRDMYYLGGVQAESRNQLSQYALLFGINKAELTSQPSSNTDEQLRRRVAAIPIEKLRETGVEIVESVITCLGSAPPELAHDLAPERHIESELRGPHVDAVSLVDVFAKLHSGQLAVSVAVSQSAAHDLAPPGRTPDHLENHDVPSALAHLRGLVQVGG